QDSSGSNLKLTLVQDALAQLMKSQHPVEELQSPLPEGDFQVTSREHEPLALHWLLSTSRGQCSLEKNNYALAAES
uniref:Uncharacterized protein n=1 Tax=Cyprinodon variegatus TaxID=28743 RepID=A0A3Q2E4V3_CYPVA